MNYYLSTRKIWKCSKCYHQFSVRTGTIFECSRVPLMKWFTCIYILTTDVQGTSCRQMHKWLGVQQKTAWFMMQRIREASFDESKIILTGIVEADESGIRVQLEKDKRMLKLKKLHELAQDAIHGPSKFKHYKAKKGTLRRGSPGKEQLAKNKAHRAKYGERIPFERTKTVMGMIERGDKGRIVFRHIGDSMKCIKKDVVFPILKQHISKDSILVTDKAIVYKDANMFVKHEVVNHSIGYVVNGITTNSVECAWRQLKSVLKTYRHTSSHHLTKYLNMQAYRYNRRKESLLTLFDDIFPMMFGKRLEYKTLTSLRHTYKIAA